MKVHATAIEEINGVICIADREFSGLVYWPRDEHELRIRHVLGGTVVAEKAFDTPWRAIKMTPELIENPDFEEIPNGTVFVFDEEGILREEYTYSGGRKGEARAWYDSGALGSCTEYMETGTTNRSWFESGQLSGLKQDGISISYDRQHGVAILVLNEECDRHKLKQLSLAVSKTLALDGSGITDEVLSLFSGLDAVKELLLTDTSLTRDGLFAFADNDLAELTTTGNSQLSAEDIAEFLANSPDLLWIDGDEFE